MKALITGASSGLGYQFAITLSQMGYDLIVVARREDKLLALKENLKTNVQIISMDLSNCNNAKLLFDKVKDQDIDILINNAGYGIYGEFIATDLENELKMVDLNCKSLHILTKLFLKKFTSRNCGYIMNVASSAAFMPGPLMATYYASKVYVRNLSSAIYQELKHNNINVHICSLCPGPVDTEFNNVAGVTFGVSSLTSKTVVSYALKQMFKHKVVIVPGLTMRLSTFATRIAPHKMLLKIAYKIQNGKKK